MNLGVLKKVNSNLSARGQYLDFRDGKCKSYKTNIKNLPTNSKSASLIALLHNIKNKYHDEPEFLEMDFFEDINEKEFSEITEWLFISKSRHFAQIKSEKNIYNILEPLEDS